MSLRKFTCVLSLNDMDYT